MADSVPCVYAGRQNGDAKIIIQCFFEWYRWIYQQGVNLIRLVVWNLFLSITLFFLADLAYTKKFSTSDPALAEKKYRIQHDYFDHSLLSGFSGYGHWGDEVYKVCTNDLGFKDDCASPQNNMQHFDLAFIGDSFTEGIGMPYEDSFVGMFAKEHPNLTVANLGVASYSPSV
ncbi:hypothetical protein HW561_11805 [Rhodobacteraceae bacterium B1Z28]|uniref:GDSL-like lipase/acylhydrolase family protein n=1 Tax=Ruegeria haliotis TaxID=2747601 RepID=A0ABX2PQP2_9RHOB|nr:hypothetical protein [Ruegeria haliotis]NVO56471.1 hypothetical protein [Ruegeria haliotis]